MPSPELPISSTNSWRPLRHSKRDDQSGPKLDYPTDRNGLDHSVSFTSELTLDRVETVSPHFNPTLTSALPSINSPDQPQHPSATAPRKSEAFKRLGQASLVSSSIFKSNPPPTTASPSRPPRPLPSPSTPVSHIKSSSSVPRSLHTPLRPQSQMAAALKGLGIADQSSSLNPTASTSTYPHPTSASAPSSQIIRKTGTKRKSDENLPPRPAPALNPSTHSLRSMDNSTQPLTPKARPTPRKSHAYTSLTRNALVSSSPFKTQAQPPIQSSAQRPPAPIVSSIKTNLSGIVSPTGSSSEDGEGSSNESDLTPGTPPAAIPNPISSTPLSPRSTTNSSSVLKNQRLGGPRSFTPPLPQSYHAEHRVGHDGLSPARPQSAMSTPGKRRERRKTVTWGGEDVLEFEREEEWRRASGASSAASAESVGSPRSNPSESDEDSREVQSDAIAPEPAVSDRRPEEFWGRRSHSSSTEVGEADQDGVEGEEAEQSVGSVIVHGLAPPEHSELETGPSFSSDTDPVDRMVNDLLTSPDLAGHVKSAMSLHQWAMPDVNVADPPDAQGNHGPVEVEDSLSLEEQVRQEEERAEAQRRALSLVSSQPSSPLKTKGTSRFPYVSPKLGHQVPSSSPKDESNLGDSTTHNIPSPADLSAIMDEPPPFRPISLPGIGEGEDSLFIEGSFASSILQEPSFLGIAPTNTPAPNGFSIPRSPGLPGLPIIPSHQHILSSTPRPSFSTDPPIPQPRFPESLAARLPPPLDSIEEHSSTRSPPGSRRPLPRLPESTSSPPLPCTDTLPGSGDRHTNLSALTAPAYTLPDIAMNSPFVMSKAEEPVPDSPNCSPGGRPRITRERIQERMRDRGATKSPEPEVGTYRLPRDPISHVASLHQLSASGDHEESVEVNKLPVTNPSTSGASVESVIAELPHEIPARPPLRARVATLSDSIIRPDDARLGSGSDQTLRQEDMDAMSSGLDKLAHGFQSSSSELFSLNDSISSNEESTDTVSGRPDEQILPSKLVRVKGAGRRRRSLSTGAADVEETGTGAGARAAVKSNSIKRTAPLSKRAQASAALLNNAVQRGMDNTDFQAPLDRALKKIMDDGQRTYRIQEAEEVVYASDNRTATVGKAGDVVDNRNWRKLRKVSDINEHEKQLKAFWAQNGNSTKIGKVFVKMSKLVFVGLPASTRPVWFEVIIDNGLHTAKTAAYKLEPEVTLGVEFELVRAKKLEFSLAFNIPLNDSRNAHLRPRKPIQAVAVAPPIPESPKRGLAAKIFGGNGRRNSKHVERPVLPPPVIQPASDPLCAYLDRDGTLAKALVNFDEYADESLGQLKTVVMPCVAAAEDPVKAAMQMRRTFTGSVGQITMEFLSLPPLPKMPDAVLPNSSGECLKGLKIAEWWQEVWHTGILSQMGADCQTWRRRTFKATGGSLFAYNDIMNKLSAEIRLAEVLRLEDCGVAPPSSPMTDASGVMSSVCSSISEQGEILPPFTFRLVFRDASEILFHADNQDDFRRWKNVLTQLIGKIQHLPVWAELLRLQITAKRAAVAQEEQNQVSKQGGSGSGAAATRLPGRRGAPNSDPNHRSTAHRTSVDHLNLKPRLAPGARAPNGLPASLQPMSASSSRNTTSSSVHQNPPIVGLSRTSQLGNPSTSRMIASSSVASSSTSSSRQPHPTPAAAIKRSMNRMDFTR